MIYTAHPLFGERERAALDADGARWRRTDLVVLHLRHSSDNLSDQPRLASLVLDSDAPKQLDEVAAAKQTLRLSDLHTGLTTNPLDAATLPRPPSLDAQLSLTNALASPRPERRCVAKQHRPRNTVTTGSDGLNTAVGHQYNSLC